MLKMMKIMMLCQKYVEIILKKPWSLLVVLSLIMISVNMRCLRRHYNKVEVSEDQTSGKDLLKRYFKRMSFSYDSSYIRLNFYLEARESITTTRKSISKLVEFESLVAKWCKMRKIYPCKFCIFFTFRNSHHFWLKCGANLCT